MTSHYFENYSEDFLSALLPEPSLLKEEAVIVIAKIAHIKAVQLPSGELERASHLSDQPTRDRYLAGRYLVRGILSVWLKIEPQDIPISLSATGKPFLPQHGYEFSISHTDKFVGAVFSAQPTGIDLEQERSLDTAALARRFFSPEEVVFLENQNFAQQDFFRLWCCREAAIKADGRGLGQLLAVTKVEPSHDEKETYTPVLIEGVIWYVYHRVLHAHLHQAIAFRKPPSVIHWRDLREPLG